MKKLLEKLTIKDIVIIILIVIIVLLLIFPSIKPVLPDLFKTIFRIEKTETKKSPEKILKELNNKVTNNQKDIDENLKESNTIIDGLMMELKRIGKNWESSEKDRLEAIENYNKTLYKLETALAEKNKLEKENSTLSDSINSLTNYLSGLLPIVKEYDSIKSLMNELSNKVMGLEKQNKKLKALNETFKEIDFSIGKNSKTNGKNVMIAGTFNGWNKIKKNFEGETTVRLYVTRLKDKKEIYYKTEIEKDGYTTPKFYKYLEYKDPILDGKDINFEYTIWENAFKGIINVKGKGEGYLFTFKIYNENVGEINIGATTLYFLKII